MNTATHIQFQTVPDSAPSDANCLLLTIIVPVFNELSVIGLFIKKLTEVMMNLGYKYEILFVDDGSTDGTSEYLQRLASNSDFVRLIQLSRNFGKEAAMTAGLDKAKGDAVILIDADLQDPPELIPDMVSAWRRGADTVVMRRSSRTGETILKRVSAYCFYRLLNFLSDLSIPPDTGDFRLLSRKAVDTLAKLPERSRYMKGLFAWIGLPVEIITYERLPRAAGKTKWSFFHLCRLAMEGIVSFSVIPLRAVTWLGGITALGSVAFGIWIVCKTFLFGEAVSGYPSIIVTVTFIGGVQLLSIGLLGEYMSRVYVESKQRPIYIIQDEFSGNDVKKSMTSQLKGRDCHA